MEAIKSRMVEGGRIVVPAAFRRALGLTKGDALVPELHGDELRVRPARSALRPIQARLAAHAPSPDEPMVSDELIAERRREVGRG